MSLCPVVAEAVRFRFERLEGLDVGLVLAAVGVGVLVLNAMGYAVESLVSQGRNRATGIASVRSIGMRVFAVAATLVIATGLPTVASLAAVAFGVVEMATSAGLATWLSRTD